MLGGSIDAHHNQVRFQWQAGPAERPDAYVGFDVIVTEDGRIRNVYGFMDAAPGSLTRPRTAAPLGLRGARREGVR